MRKLLVGVALVGIAMSIALLAQKQLKTSPDAPAPAVASSSRADRTPATVDRGAEHPAEAQAATTQPAGPQPAAHQAAAHQPAGPQLAAPDPATRSVSSPSPSPSPSQSAGVLKSASAAYKNIRTLKADFAQTRTNPLLESTTRSRGTLYQKRPDRFLMKFSEPAGDVIVSDGRYFWLYYPSADRRQVLRAPAGSGAAGGVDLQAQFLGNPLERFTHSYHGIETLNGRKAHVVTMIPRSNMGYKSLKVWIDTKDSLVRRFILTENNGVVLDISLSNLVVNPKLSDDVFHFTPPADARIIENP